MNIGLTNPAKIADASNFCVFEVTEWGVIYPILLTIRNKLWNNLSILLGRFLPFFQV